MSGEYNETQLRREFLDPFFTGLGWDVENKQGYAEAYKDVVHEDAIKIGTATKAPDYSFRIGGLRKFFVEAKKPSVNLKEDISPAYQIRRYAWSAKLPLSILTDFEEFVVYDCRIKPNPSDKSSVGRVLYFKYSEYSDKWEEIASIFSREAVLKGSFDKYVESTKGKRGTAEVDDAFLKEIETWRELLAKNIAISNPKLTVRDLNFAVQRTIDRIIFLRICEDRGIETYGTLLGLTNGSRIYKRLCEIFYRADEKYNSGLFHFHKEKERTEPPDEFTPNLDIDDNPLKEIIKSLYYPDSSYEFSVLPADILGQVYEQFLGKVIRLTEGHQAKVEDKPEVKKAGGVYYTPTYIVDYIVKNTVGKILEELASKDKDKKIVKSVSKLRILDPACGSGSFLIGAYQYLLNWHRDWYVNDGTKKWVTGKNPTLYQAQGGELRLTAAERKRILLNNIYGVDIDPQAVEVTKLSLLLKVLEGENEQTISQQLKMFHQRALPDLANNIKCGNSLIGPDFYEGRQLSLMDDEERIKINAFDWSAEFKEIMDAGGFDVLIGNPPWVSAWTGDESIRGHLSQREPLLTGHWDLYLAFLLRALSLLADRGWHGFVLPTSILTEQYATDVRKNLIEGHLIASISTFGIDRVFGKVSRKVCILILRNGGSIEETSINEWETGSIVWQKTIDARVWTNNFNHMIDLRSSVELVFLKNKLSSRTAKVGNYYYVNYGAQISSKIKGSFTKARLLNKEKKENAKRCLIGADVKRYFLTWNKLWLDYQPQIMYGPRHPKFFESEKIIVNKTSSKGFSLIATYDDQGFYCDQRLICLVSYEAVTDTGLQTDFSDFAKIPSSESILYHLGLLNSKPVSFYFRKYVATKNLQGEYTDVLPQMVRALPIRMINFSDPAEKSHHDQMVNLVETMLDLHEKLAAAKTEQDQTPIKRQIEVTDKQIDELVYELYGLTEEEKKIVEGVEERVIFADSAE